MNKNVEKVHKQTHTISQQHIETDVVICEQPLQINVSFSAAEHFSNIEPFVYTVTMRTPGNEAEQIIGLLLSDGVIGNVQQIITMSADEHSTNNLWDIELEEGCYRNITSINKYQTTFSSCGLCGTTSLKALELKTLPALSLQKHWLNKSLIFSLESRLFQAQTVQHATGGAHCAALFDSTGDLLSIKEDIGRHNALDKLIGYCALNGISLTDAHCYLVISSRVSFEMVQKALMAGIPVLIALGAPSSLAIQAAKRFNLTLIAFAKGNTINVYHGDWRLISDYR